MILKNVITLCHVTLVLKTSKEPKGKYVPNTYLKIGSFLFQLLITLYIFTIFSDVLFLSA